ncbi:hypothetical protein [Nocardioides lentus]
MAGSLQKPPPRKARHLIDFDAPPPPPDPEAERRLERVQQWVLSVLVVTTIVHLVVGLVIAAVTLAGELYAQVGLVLISGLFMGMAVATARAIHRRRALSAWLLISLVPVAVGLWLLSR